jgi:FkbM family methyltransferase
MVSGAAGSGMRTAACHIPRAEPLEVSGSDDDIGVLASIERTGCYEPDVLTALHDLGIDRDAVLIDGGGNIGVFAMALARYAPEGQVYSFEPSAENRAHLCANVAQNGIGNVEVVPQGLWRESAELHLQVDPRHPGGAFVDEQVGAADTSEAVEVVSLDEWCDARGIERVDVIKLDIEGAEPFAVEGAARTIRRFRPRLLVECNPGALRRLQPDSSVGDFFRQLRALYPVVAYVRENGATTDVPSVWFLRRVLNRKGYVDLICLPTRRGWRERPRKTARWVSEYAQLLWRYNRFRPSPQAFAVEPSYRATFAERSLRIEAGERRQVEVRVKNTGAVWFDSWFPFHPIYASYHWLDRDGAVVERDGLRTALPRAVRPGRSVSIPLEVVGPQEPGEYQLAFGLVQEQFAWLTDLRPELLVSIPVEVV